VIRSLYSGLSGLRNHETQLDVIGNNIANLNTVGFKSARVTFEEMLPTTVRSPVNPTQTLGGQNPLQVGVGSKIGSITTLFTQGGIQTTGAQTDLAIQGKGFFVLSNGGSYTYSRDGSFQFDAMGRMVSPSTGFVVQGKMADSTGKLPPGTKLEDIRLAYGLEVPANATTKMTLSGNLDADAESLGSIIETNRVYSKELSGSGSDINGLFAAGTTNNAISGMSIGSTTVTISDGGTIGTKIYTYTPSDLGVRDNSFMSLDDLIGEINQDYAGSLQVALDNEGRLVFTNQLADEEGTSVENNLTLVSSNSLFKRALSGANGV
jgi:flagellar hook protein FlgE